MTSPYLQMRQVSDNYLKTMTPVYIYWQLILATYLCVNRLSNYNNWREKNKEPEYRLNLKHEKRIDRKQENISIVTNNNDKPYRKKKFVYIYIYKRKTHTKGYTNE